MATPLDHKLDQIRSRVRRILWIYGFSWLIAVVFSVVLVVGLADWLIHLDDSGVRLILSLGIFGIAATIAWRYLCSPLMQSMSNVDLALRIEQRFPGFNDSLASTVQFLHDQQDARLGSPTMQQQVIDHTLGELRNVDLSDIVDTREVVRIVTVALCVCVVVGAIVGMNQAESAIALNRLIFPLSDSPWPRAIELRMVDSELVPLDMEADEPLFIARGDTLEMFVENVSGALPPDVAVEYRKEDGSITQEMLRTTNLVDDQGKSRELAAVSRVVDEAIEFRAVGGDDHEMPWYKVDAIPPPEIAAMKVTLKPPAYSKQPEATLADGVGHVRGLVGTSVSVVATVNKPLKLASLRLKDKSPIPLEITNEGRSIRAQFEIAEAGVSSYWFAFTDQQGFENSVAPRYEIRGIPDQTPSVFFEEPSTDLRVTANATIPLRVSATDDMGIKSLKVVYRLADAPASADDLIVLFDGPERPTELKRDYLWELAKLNLQQGMRITLHAESADECDLVADHIGRSISRTLFVVSAEEKLDELADREAELLDELETVARTQGRANEHVNELMMQLDKVGELRPEDIDMLKRIELDQRQIATRMTNPADGFETRVKQLLKEFEQNEIQINPAARESKAAATRRLKGLENETGFLKRDVIPAIERELTRARKSISPNPDADKKTEKQTGSKDSEQKIDGLLAKTDEHQKAMLESLNSMRDAMSKWRKHRDLTSDLQDVRDGQQAVKQETAELGRDTISQPLNQLKPQQQAELAKLSERQRKQAEELENFRRRLQESADQIAEENPELADPLLNAVDELEQRATSGQMRESANQIGKNQIGQVTQTQDQILKDLNELGEILKKRSIDDSSELLKKLKQAESEMETLKKRQEELLKKSADAVKLQSEVERKAELQKLSKQQEQLRRDVRDMARRLRRLQARESDASARRATGRMEQAESELQNGNSDRAKQQQREALDDLEQATRELSQTRREAEERLAQEQLERVADELDGLVARQQNVIDETRRIQTTHAERIKSEGRLPDNWKRSETRSLRQLSEVQLGLKVETERLTESMQGIEVVILALRGAGRMMQQAADRLKDRKPDNDTIEIEESVKQRLVDLLSVLRPDPDSQQAGQTQQQRPQNGQENVAPQREAVPQLAQLKLLKKLQEDLNRRTAKFDASRDGKIALNDDDKQQLEYLANEQKQIADLMQDLMRQYLQTEEVENE